MRQVTCLYEDDCLTCGESIAVGTLVNWEKNVGIWHTACATPKNLKLYKKEVKRTPMPTKHETHFFDD